MRFFLECLGVLVMVAVLLILVFLACVLTEPPRP
jgi:hypothetical protein